MIIGHRGAAASPIEVCNELTIAAPVGRVWELLSGIARWPSWHRASRWVRLAPPADGEDRLTFRWRAHPVLLDCTVAVSEAPHEFAFVAVGWGVYARHSFTLRSTRDCQETIVTSHETQDGWLPWMGRWILAPRLDRVNQEWLHDLAVAATRSHRASPIAVLSR
jgi:uncharacterized protein YndB with AHSA1/START domain